MATLSEEITADTQLQRRGTIVDAMVDEQMVLMHVDRGCFHSLEETGLRVWELIDGTGTVGDLVTKLCEEYEVDEETCLQDLSALLKTLHEHDLIEFTHQNI